MLFEMHNANHLDRVALGPTIIPSKNSNRRRATYLLDVTYICQFFDVNAQHNCVLITNLINACETNTHTQLVNMNPHV